MSGTESEGIEMYDEMARKSIKEITNRITELEGKVEGLERAYKTNVLAIEKMFKVELSKVETRLDTAAQAIEIQRNQAIKDIKDETDNNIQKLMKTLVHFSQNIDDSMREGIVLLNMLKERGLSLE